MHFGRARMAACLTAAEAASWLIHGSAHRPFWEAPTTAVVDYPCNLVQSNPPESDGKEKADVEQKSATKFTYDKTDNMKFFSLENFQTSARSG